MFFWDGLSWTGLFIKSSTGSQNLVCFLDKIASCAYLKRVSVAAQLRIFCNSSLRSLAVRFLLRATEKKDVLLEDNLGFAGKSSDR